MSEKEQIKCLKILDLINKKYNKYAIEPLDLTMGFILPDQRYSASNNYAVAPLDLQIMTKIYKCMDYVDNNTFGPRLKIMNTSVRISNKVIHNITNQDFYHFLIKGTISYNIDPVKANLWINSQCCDLTRETAKLFIKNTLYISHKDMISQFREIADQIKPIYKKSVVIMGDDETKSNYFFNILFMSIMYHEYGLLPFHVCNEIKEVYHLYGSKVNYLDIDDMMYSGTQTTSSLQYDLVNIKRIHMHKKNIVDELVNRALIPEIAKMVISEFPNKNYPDMHILDKRVTKDAENRKLEIVLTRFLEHFYLLKTGFTYYLIRPYASIYSRHEIRYSYLLMTPVILINKVKVPHLFHSINNNIRIRYFEDLYKKNNFLALVHTTIANIIFNQFNECPVTACYSNYKVADPASTFTYVYLFGPVASYDDIMKIFNWDFIFAMEELFDALADQLIIPILNKEQQLRLAEDVFNFLKTVIKSSKITTPVSKSISFVKNCNLQCNIFDDFCSDMTRCPESWYKKLKYLN